MQFRKRSSLCCAFACLALPVFSFAQSSSTITSVSSASYRGVVSPGSLVSFWGTGFSTVTSAANSNPPVTLPTTLAGFSLAGVDNAGVKFNPGLYLVSPGQINYVLPDNISLGRATITTNSGAASGPVYVSNVSPAIFTADGSGTGVPAAQILRVNAANQATYEMSFQSGASTYQPRPIDISTATDRVFLILYGTGIRLHSLNPVIVMVNGVQVPVTYAGVQSTYPGLDQINVGPIPASLNGSGTVNAVVTVDGVPANTVQIAFK